MLNVLADAFMVFYALWTIVEQLSYFFGLSFAQAWSVATLVGTAGVGVFFYLAGTECQTTLSPAEQRPSAKLAGNALGNEASLWTKFEAMCIRRYGNFEARIRQCRAFQVFDPITKEPPQFFAATAGLRIKSIETDSLWTVVCWICAIGAAVVTMCLHRPDTDDIVYLGNTVFALDSTGVPIRSLTELANGYVLTSYDFIRAAFSWATGTPVLVSYYIIWPAFIAVLVVVFQFRLFRLAGVKNIAMVAVVFFVVMLAWGDVHRTPANFGFVRLFQGKGPLIWLAIPAALYYWLHHMQYNGTRPLILLYCAIVAGVGFSPTGVLTSLLLVCMFAVATLVEGRFARIYWRRAFVIGLAGAYPLAIGLVMRHYFDYSSQGMHTAEGIVDSAKNSAILESTLLGSNLRGVLALLAVLVAPILLRRNTSNVPLRIYFWICLVLLVFPWTSEIFAKLGFMTFSWRWFYVLPFALAMVVAVDRLGRSDWPLSVRFATVTLAVALFVFSSPRWVVSPENYTELRLPGFKLPHATEAFLAQYNSDARIEGVWLISPSTARRF
jgi:hypothetical protein